MLNCTDGELANSVNDLNTSVVSKKKKIRRQNIFVIFACILKCVFISVRFDNLVSFLFVGVN